tara:strand:- start:9194 stop:10930 length:1737 start_codon:yes stop_codon:yes gene_type:complete
MYGTLADIRNELRVRLGLPERGDSGDARLTTIINMALRQIWSEMPKALLSKEHRFMLQPALTPKTKSSTGFVKANELFFGATSPKTVSLGIATIASSGGGIDDYESDTPIPTDGTYSGRTIEIKIGDTYHYRKIQSVYTDTNTSTTTNTNKDGTTTTYTEQTQYIVLDNPLPYSGSQVSPTGEFPTPWTYRLLCEEYPYPDNVQQVLEVVIDPDSNPHPVLQSTFQNELYNYRSTIGYRTEGRPETYCRGSFYQMPAPAYEPIVHKNPPNKNGMDQKWGFEVLSSSHIELNTDLPNTSSSSYENAGAAGTFKYIVVHVWGRQPNYNVHFKENPSSTSPKQLQAVENKPFYRSGPSQESEEISVKWGERTISVNTPNLDYVYGYGANLNDRSYNQFGYEKYIFRARMRTDNEPADGEGAHPDAKNVEADGKFYLLAIRPGYETEFIDNGTYDPPDKRFPLQSHNGHFHIRFDRQPTEAKPVLLRTFTRPPLLRFPTDTPTIPPEGYDLLYSLAASYLVGDRDGVPARKSMYYQEYLTHLKRIRKTYNVPGHQVGSFGNGLSTKRSFKGPRRNRNITESS